MHPLTGVVVGNFVQRGRFLHLPVAKQVAVVAAPDHPALQDTWHVVPVVVAQPAAKLRAGLVGNVQVASTGEVFPARRKTVQTIARLRRGAIMMDGR